MKMNQRGQALIETVAFFMAFSGLIICLLGLTQWFTVRQKLLVAAREAALLYSSGDIQRDKVQSLVSHYLTTGSPALAQERIKIDVGPYSGFQAKLFSLDQVTIHYTIQSSWIRAIGLNPTMEETCILKHAPHYGPPFQTLWGPPYPY
jgi:hypothetical protein